MGTCQTAESGDPLLKRNFPIRPTKTSASSGCSSIHTGSVRFVPDIVPLSSQRENTPAHAGVFSYYKKSDRDLDDGHAERFLDAYAEVGMRIFFTASGRNRGER